MKIWVLMILMLNEVQGKDTKEAECWTPAGSAFFTYFYRLIDASNSTHAMCTNSHQNFVELCEMEKVRKIPTSLRSNNE